ncbi:MAG: hypothetical protein V3U09_03655 [Thermoplasmata archaeon]
MGGELKKGNSIVSGVVPDEVRDFLREQVKTGKFTTVSKAVKHYLSSAARNAGVELPPDELRHNEIRSNNVRGENLKPKGFIRTAMEKWTGRGGNKDDRI